jgi:BASS family bile acid:Na+ symporter
MLRPIVLFALSNIVSLFMFSAGLSRSPGSLKQVVQRPALYGRALGVVLLAVPLLGFAVVHLFRLPPVAAGALLLTAVCPGAPLQVNQAKSLGASVVTSLNLLLLLALCALDVAAVVGAIILVRVLSLTPYKLWLKRQARTERASRVPPGGVPT